MPNLTVKAEKKRKTSENGGDSIIPAKKAKPVENNKAQQANKSKDKNNKQQGNQMNVKKFKGTAQVIDSDEQSNKGKKGQFKKQKGQFHELRKKLNANLKKEVILAEIDKKIEAIANRKELSKTAKRKLKLLKKIRAEAETGQKITKAPNNQAAVSSSKKRRERKKTLENGKKVEVKQEKKVQVKEEKKSPIKQENKKIEVKQEKKKIAVKQEESSESDFEMVIDEKGESVDDEQDESEASDVEEESDSDDEIEGEEDENDDSGGNVSSEGEVEQKPQIKKDNNIPKPKQSRYVLFIGNIPFDAEKREIMQHFKNCGKIKDVRIQTDRKTNRPRGCAYLELENAEAYQKAMSMHHSTMKGRRINVLYSQGGNKNSDTQKKEIKAKNFKLQAMRKQGKLAGSVKENQKRSFRRNKKNAANKANDS